MEKFYFQGKKKNSAREGSIFVATLLLILLKIFTYYSPALLSGFIILLKVIGTGLKQKKVALFSLIFLDWKHFWGFGISSLHFFSKKRNPTRHVLGSCWHTEGGWGQFPPVLIYSDSHARSLLPHALWFLLFHLALCYILLKKWYVPFTCKQSSMDDWQYGAQTASIWGLSWGHTVWKLGNNPDLGNAVQRVSITGTDCAEHSSSKSQAPGLMSTCRFWSAWEGRRERDALSSQTTWQLYLPSLLFFQSSAGFSPVGTKLPPSCAALQTVQIVQPPPVRWSLEQKQPSSASQRFRIRRPHTATSPWVPAPSISSPGASRAPSIIALRLEPQSFSPAHRSAQDSTAETRAHHRANCPPPRVWSSLRIYSLPSSSTGSVKYFHSLLSSEAQFHVIPARCAF